MGMRNFPICLRPWEKNDQWLFIRQIRISGVVPSNTSHSGDIPSGYSEVSKEVRYPVIPAEAGIHCVGTLIQGFRDFSDFAFACGQKDSRQSGKAQILKIL